MPRRISLVVSTLLACCGIASALNPSLDVSQYAHTAWTAREGFFKGSVYSFAQTPDGYLWVGTEFGLLRFDGVRFVAWQPQTGEHLPSGDVRSLLAAHDGRLWIGTGKGLASWNDGKLTEYPELAGLYVGSLLEDRAGTVWASGVASPTGRICAIRSGGAQCFGADGSIGAGVFSLCEDSGRNLWAASPYGLWQLRPEPPKFYPMRDQPNNLIEGYDGAPLVATSVGVRRFVGGRAEAYQVPGVGRQFRATKLFRDRNGALWIGTDGGVLHVHDGKTDLFAHADGLSGNYIVGFFEDREGDIWVATLDGLDRFREYAVPTISVDQGLSGAVLSVLAASDGSVWLGTVDGVNRWNNGQTTIYRKRSDGVPDDNVEALFQDDHRRIWVITFRGAAYFDNGRFVPVRGLPGGGVHSISGDGDGDLWISYQDLGLFHLGRGSLFERTPWAKLGRKDFADALLPDAVRGGLWLGFRNGGIAYLKNGQVLTSYTTADGLGGGRVNDLELDQDGTLWAATEGGLSRIKSGQVATLTSKNGLPCDTVHWAMKDADHSLWLYTACGLVRISQPELDGWANDPKRTIRYTVFSESDGVRSHATAPGTTARPSQRPPMENCGSWLAKASASSIRVTFPSTNSRRRCTSSRSSPTARPPKPLQTCACPR